MEEKTETRKIFKERFKALVAKWEQSHPGEDPNKKATQEKIGIEIETKQENVSNWLNEKFPYVPRVKELLKISKCFKVSIDYLVGNEKKDEGEMVQKIPTDLETAIQTILDHIEAPEVLRAHGELFLLPILHLSDMGIVQSQTPDRLILQEAVCGRRKNVVPIRVNSEGKMNIFLFGKREPRKERLP